MPDKKDLKYLKIKGKKTERKIIFTAKKASFIHFSGML